MTPAETIAAIAVLNALVSDEVRGDIEPSDGPPERCIAELDLLAKGDAAEERETRWREGAA